MNREQRRKIAKMERKEPILKAPELSEKCKQFIAYGKTKGMDFNLFFLMFSFWISLTKNEKTAVVMELVSQGLVTPDKESEKSTESGWKKLDENGEIIKEEESDGECSSECEGCSSDSVLLSGSEDKD